MPGQFQQNVFPLGTKPPQEEEEDEERECSESEDEEENSDDGFNAGEGGEKGICRKYEDHSYPLFLCFNTIYKYSVLGPHGGTGGSPWCDEAKGQVTGVEVGAETIWTICRHDQYQDHDHFREPRHDRNRSS